MAGIPDSSSPLLPHFSDPLSGYSHVSDPKMFIEIYLAHASDGSQQQSKFFILKFESKTSQ
jgi:hypothetical protein